MPLICQEKSEKTLKDVYWKHIRSAKQRIQEENPELGKKEVLKRARAES